MEGLSELYVRKIAIDWDRIPADSYLREIPSIANLEELEFSKNVTFFVGENGSGKSTLLEAIAVANNFNAEGGTINYHFSTYDDVSELGGAIRQVRGYRKPKSGYFFRAESFFNVASVIMNEYNDGGQPDYHAESHGESFLNFMSGFKRDGLYLMDEPEAALSPQRQLSLLIHIAKMAVAGSQFIIVTHSPILLAVPGAEILSFDEGEIHPCAYEETESYQITKLFIENREAMLRRLLE